jgi:putative membrane protein
MSVLFGVLFAGAALALWKGLNLLPLGFYALFAGLASVVIGVRFIDLGLSQTPILSGAGFILTGLGGIFALPVLYLRGNRALRTAGAIVLLAATAVWSLTGYGALWAHMESFGRWVPVLMR